MHPVDVAVDEKLLDLALEHSLAVLEHSLAVYDASYLALAKTRGVAIAPVDAKLQRAAESMGIELIKP